MRGATLPGMRTQLTPGQLYARLNDEWQRLRPPACDRCRMPLPVLLPRPDNVSANWRIGAAPWCAHRCDGVIAEIASRLWPLYDLVED
jgi:hypothetical protein